MLHSGKKKKTQKQIIGFATSGFRVYQWTFQVLVKGGTCDMSFIFCPSYPRFVITRVPTSIIGANLGFHPQK